MQVPPFGGCEPQLCDGQAGNEFVDAAEVMEDMAAAEVDVGIAVDMLEPDIEQVPYIGLQFAGAQ